ncbi:cell envelope integrity protein TolA [Rheinheimera sp.]|uniref:cell envelope integrity protein TolA n=1 Tax=Rheinheimera sp. TaxID=1869214 RepID=UPI00307D0B2D
MLFTSLLFAAAVTSTEPRLRIEKIDPDGKVTVREIPKKSPPKPYTAPQMQAETEVMRKAIPGQALTEKQRYLAMIVAQIQQHWFVDDAMRGKECRVNMKLSPQGYIQSVSVLDGDVRLCNSAIKAIASSGPFPMSKDPEVYEALKDLTPILKPELR